MLSVMYSILYTQIQTRADSVHKPLKSWKHLYPVIICITRTLILPLHARTHTNTSTHTHTHTNVMIMWGGQSCQSMEQSKSVVSKAMKWRKCKIVLWMREHHQGRRECDEGGREFKGGKHSCVLAGSIERTSIVKPVNNFESLQLTDNINIW